MVRSVRSQLSILAGLAVMLTCGLASAQAAPPAGAPAKPAGGAPAAGAPAGGAAAGGAAAGADIKTTQATGKEGYGYEFSDDPLNAGGFGPNDATIRVRPGPVRTTLIRPRTSFVPELLKSVENL